MCSMGLITNKNDETSMIRRQTTKRVTKETVFIISIQLISNYELNS